MRTSALHLRAAGLRLSHSSQEVIGQADPGARQYAKVQSARAVEHVFAHQKGLRGLFVRTIGLARARIKIGLANLTYNIRRFVWLIARK